MQKRGLAIRRHSLFLSSCSIFAPHIRDDALCRIEIDRVQQQTELFDQIVKKII